MAARTFVFENQLKESRGSLNQITVWKDGARSQRQPSHNENMIALEVLFIYCLFVCGAGGFDRNVFKKPTVQWPQFQL